MAASRSRSVADSFRRQPRTAAGLPGIAATIPSTLPLTGARTGADAGGRPLCSEMEHRGRNPAARRRGTVPAAAVAGRADPPLPATAARTPIAALRPLLRARPDWRAKRCGRWGLLGLGFSRRHVRAPMPEQCLRACSEIPAEWAEHRVGPEGAFDGGPFGMRTNRARPSAYLAPRVRPAKQPARLSVSRPERAGNNTQLNFRGFGGPTRSTPARIGLIASFSSPVLNAASGKLYAQGIERPFIKPDHSIVGERGTYLEFTVRELRLVQDALSWTEDKQTDRRFYNVSTLLKGSAEIAGTANGVAVIGSALNPVYHVEININMLKPAVVLEEQSPFAARARSGWPADLHAYSNNNPFSSDVGRRIWFLQAWIPAEEFVSLLEGVKSERLFKLSISTRLDIWVPDGEEHLEFGKTLYLAPADNGDLRWPNPARGYIASFRWEAAPILLQKEQRDDHSTNGVRSAEGTKYQKPLQEILEHQARRLDNRLRPISILIIVCALLLAALVAGVGIALLDRLSGH